MEPNVPASNELPTAAPHRSAHRSRIPLVWVVPAVAAVIGVWLGIHAYLDRGPTITVTFLDAEGIEAGKTKVRYESVDIGTVATVAPAQDRRTVDVTIETAKFAAPFLVTGTRFWIVRPRLGATVVSGLGTLLSGAFIAMDAGTSKEEARDFTGLELPPAVAGSATGRQFVLDAADVRSLSVSSPVYFHHIAVGQISSIALNPDGRGVTLTAFINTPYDAFVTRDTRFWHASGVDVEVDSSGVHVQSESMATILAGGIAFDSLPSSTAGAPAAEGTHFRLGANRQASMKTADATSEPYVLYFEQSLRGLAPGAAVDFRGMEVGEVVAVNLEYERSSGKLRFPVLIDIYPERVQSRYAKGDEAASTLSRALVGRLVEQGLRAQLRTASLLTGQLYIALDFFPRSVKVTAQPTLTPMPLPTVPGNFEELQNSLASVAHKLDQLPLDKIAHDLDVALVSLNGTLGSTNGVMAKVESDILPEAKSTLSQARHSLQQTLAPEAALQNDLHTTLSSVGRAADSIRVLADYLDAHPEALLRGKKEDPK
ncbi:MAG TPA: MlaD family protein [Steroidobacteraceae bacterium]